MISLVIPAFNAERTIARTLRAALRQTVLLDEIVVVDDGSTDSTAATVEAIGDSRIRLVRQDNRGVSAARNRGAMAALRELIAFCDADDQWEPGFIQAMLDLRRKYPHAAVLGSSYWVAPPDGKPYKARLNGWKSESGQGIFERYFDVASESDPPLHSSAVVVNRSALFDVGGFPEKVVSGEDLLTWAKLAAKYEIAYDRRPLATFHSPARADFRRTSDGFDKVGHILALLQAETTEAQRDGLKRYRARWHEMRTVIALGQHDAAQARQHAAEMFRLRPAAMRSTALLAMSWLPQPLGQSLFEFTRSRRQPS